MRKIIGFFWFACKKHIFNFRREVIIPYMFVRGIRERNWHSEYIQTCLRNFALNGRRERGQELEALGFCF